MQDMFGSVRRSLVFRTLDGDGDGGGGDPGSLVEKIGSCIRKSRVFSRHSPPPPLPPVPTAPAIRWRKGELIGCGAFGRVYMGMNLDSGELLAVKQVLITASNATKEKAQAHIRELEEEVKLLKTLSHPNIVRYLGTVREGDTLNILLEFVPGGSISSLLGKFGSFPEAVIRMYTKQLLLGLQYLHKNGIMHRDIKGANILVDNKGGIKLADFGASKQVAELATITGAKSMKGTPYWMAPEVILQTGHSFSADIWSVGCTVIEMATGKPPWSQQYQEVAALFHIGTTKSHPPIPDHLSEEAKDFLLKCLQKEPDLRQAASVLLQHPFVIGEDLDPLLVPCSPVKELSGPTSTSAPNLGNLQMTTNNDSMDVCELGDLSCSNLYPEKLMETGYVWGAKNSNDDMCQIDDRDDSASKFDDFKSLNPVCEPTDDWMFGGLEPTKEGVSQTFDQAVSRPVHSSGALSLKSDEAASRPVISSGEFSKDNISPSLCEPSLSEDDDELTESKIKAFLDEKALELKKLQTPLYEEFYNILNETCSSNVEITDDKNGPNYLKLPPKSRSPNQVPAGTPSVAIDAASIESPGSGGVRLKNVGSPSNKACHVSSTPNIDAHQDTTSPSMSFSERQRKWKEELDRELERKREMMRQAGIVGKTSSPKNRPYNQRERSRFASPGN